jgi:hypothetical protein
VIIVTVSCDNPDCPREQVVTISSDQLYGNIAVKHGTVSGYTNGRCRCPECRSAKSADNKARRDTTRLTGAGDKCGTLISPDEPDTLGAHRFVA